MPDCRNGGRTVYERPAEMPPIEGFLAYIGGTKSKFTFSRIVNGKVRVVDYVDVDGERYVRAARRDWDDCEVD